jgi:hypothetical protein
MNSDMLIVHPQFILHDSLRIRIMGEEVHWLTLQQPQRAPLLTASSRANFMEEIPRIPRLFQICPFNNSNNLAVRRDSGSDVDKGWNMSWKVETNPEDGKNPLCRKSWRNMDRVDYVVIFSAEQRRWYLDTINSYAETVGYPLMRTRFPSKSPTGYSSQHGISDLISRRFCNRLPLGLFRSCSLCRGIGSDWMVTETV